MFTPIRTERLLLRPFRAGDVEGLFQRRNDPDVSRYQDWEKPYPLERATELVDELLAMDGPENDEWWMAAVADASDQVVLGDLALHLTWEGRTAEVGYTFARQHWGHGFATEALAALVDYLFESLRVTRVFGMLHPVNRASAMVLERTGHLFEGHTRSSFWDADEVSDDHIYGMVRSDWLTWRNRLRTPPNEVRLTPVTLDNVRLVSRLRTHRSQEHFVAPMLQSFRDALFPEVVDGAPVVPWMRAIEADGVIVGFVMMASTTDHHPEPYLWRLLIDRIHQRRGIGNRALDLVEAEFLAAGDTGMLTSWRDGKGSPAPFYLARRFVPTGRLVDGETEARKRLA